MKKNTKTINLKYGPSRAGRPSWAKTRGPLAWKDCIPAAEWWAVKNKAPNLDKLRESEFYQARLVDIGQFGSLPVSLSFKEILLKIACEVLESWNTACEELKQAYYLKLHWFEPYILKSAIYLAIGDRREIFERESFVNFSQESIPSEIKSILADRDRNLELKCTEEFDFIAPEEKCELSSERRKVLKAIFNGDGSIIYAEKSGLAWIIG